MPDLNDFRVAAYSPSDRPKTGVYTHKRIAEDSYHIDKASIDVF
jgi:hypothetical protein